MDQITVIFENFSGFSHTFEIHDLVCESSQTLFFDEWEKRDAVICSSGAHDSGYGKIKYKKQEDASWTEVSLITDGQIIKLG